MSETPWMQTFSGRAFPLLGAQAEDVYWPDVIYALSHINRYSGQVGTFSVAQHSCIVASQLPEEWRLHGLLHDAHEAYTGDITAPVKAALRSFSRGVDWIARDADLAIYEAAGLLYPVPETIAEAVHIADLRAAMTERRDLLKNGPPKPWPDEYEALRPLPEHITRWTPQQSITRFAGALSAAGLDVSVSFLAM